MIFIFLSKAFQQHNLLTLPQLTVGMLIREPVVFGILEFKVGVAKLALLGSEIFKVLRALVYVAQLVIIVDSRTVLAAV